MLHARQDYNNRIQDAANIIPADEPVFLLRGQDALAPGILIEYANRLEEALELENNSDRSVIIAVRTHADTMLEYQKQTDRCKLADMPMHISIYDNVVDNTITDIDFEDNIINHNTNA